MMMRAGRVALGPEFAGLSVGFTDWGSLEAGRTVLCVHGLTRNARDFDFLAARLSRVARVLCLDVPGRGLSDWLADPRGYDVEHYARICLAFLDRLSLVEVDWVGTSMGGLIGMTVAAGPGNPIARLVLNDIGARVPAEALAPIGAYLGLDLAFASIAEVEAHMRVIHAGFGPLNDAQWRHLAEHSVRRDGARWRLHYDPNIRVPFEGLPAQDIDLWSLWDRIERPVLILHGATSQILPASVAEEMIRRGPHADLVTFEGIGHAPALMEATQIERVSNFLAL